MSTVAGAPPRRPMAGRIRLAQSLLVLIVIGGFVYIADGVVGGTLFTDPTRVTLHLRDAGGLHPQSTVNYRGQTVGKVTAVHLDADGVVADLVIDHGVDVPTDSAFEVRNLSAVGEQYVDIRPRTAAGPYLADGAVIGTADTSTPLPVYRVVADAQQLLERIALEDLSTLSREAGTALGGDRVDLRGTSVELQAALGTLRALQPDLSQLIRDGETPLTTGVDKAPELHRLARNLSLVAAQLRVSDPAIATLIDRGAVLVPMLQRLWAALAPTLASTVAVADPLTAMSAAHLPGLRVWLDWIPRQAEVMALSTRDGTGHVVLVPEALHNCFYVEKAPSPYDLREPPPDLDRRCTTTAPGIQGRGSQHTPRQ